MTEGSRNMTAICNLPPAPGPCRAAMPQWFYNPKKQRCMRFIYGGCGGNDNNFDTKEECKKACMRNKGKDRWSLKVWWEHYHKMLVVTKLKTSIGKRKRVRVRNRSGKNKMTKRGK